MSKRLVFGLVLLLGTYAFAQEWPKAEVFLGYSGIRVNTASQVNAFTQNGGLGDVQFNLNRFAAIVAEFGGVTNGSISVRGPARGVQQTQFTYLFGPRINVNKAGKFSPFLEYLIGGSHNSRSFSVSNTLIPVGFVPPSGITLQSGSPGFTKVRSTQNALAMAVGGGIDLNVSHRFAIRPIEVNYLPTHFSPLNVTGASNISPFLNRTRWQQNVRWATGIKVRFGGAPPPVPHASCTGTPNELLSDDPPVSVSMQTAQFNPKHTLDYKWSSTGGQVTQEGGGAKVNVASLSPGSYTVNGTATDPKQKTNNVASCNVAFTVKEPRPPQVSCAATPSSIQAGSGTPVALTAQGTSPDQRKIEKRDFTASAGAVQEAQTKAGEQVGEFSSTATLDTKGVQSGPINVKMAVTDTRGLTGTCEATVNVEPPPEPVKTVVTETLLGECQFSNAKKPTRVDNECKATLDQTALRLQQEPNGKLVVVGYADTEEQVTFPDQRAVNVKNYLTGGEGQQKLDPDRVEVRKGSGGGKKTSIYFLPPGATWSQQDTTVVNETH